MNFANITAFTHLKNFLKFYVLMDLFLINSFIFDYAQNKIEKIKMADTGGSKWIA